MPIKLNSILTGVEHHQGYLLVEHGPQKLSPAESVGEVEAGQGEWETEEGEVSQHDHHWTNSGRLRRNKRGLLLLRDKTRFSHYLECQERSSISLD